MLVQTGRAPGPADFWRALLDSHNAAPRRPGDKAIRSAEDAAGFREMLLARQRRAGMEVPR